MALPGSYQIEIDIELTGGDSPDPPDGSYGCTTINEVALARFFFFCYHHQLRRWLL